MCDLYLFVCYVIVYSRSWHVKERGMKSMFRRKRMLLSTLLLVALLAFTAGAAANSVHDWADDVKSRHDGTQITVAMATHPSTESFQKMVGEFEELTGVNVRWDVMEEIYLRDKVLTEHTAGTGRYDVLMMDVVWLGEFAAKRVVDELSEYLNDAAATPDWFDYDDIIPAYSQGLGARDGEVYGIPSAGESAFIAYRKDLFEKYGYDPASIETYDDLLEAAAFFHEKESGLSGISMRGRRGHHIVYGWFQSLYPFGGKVFQDGTFDVAINSPETVQSLQYFVDLMQYAPVGIENFSHEEATTTFMQGDAALWFDATALAPWIENPVNSEVAGSVGYLPPPAGPEGAFAAVAGWNLAVSSNSKNKDAAWAFIAYMTSRAKAEEYVKGGGVATRLSILEEPAFLSEFHYHPEVIESLDLAYKLVEQNIEWRPRIPEWPQIGEILGLAASQALTGRLDPQMALDQAAGEVETLLRMRGY